MYQVTNMKSDSYEYKCPLVAQNLFKVMEVVLTTAGYPAHQQGLWSGSCKSTSGNFVIGRQHPVSKVFRLVWYDHATGSVGMKDFKGKKSFEAHDYKVCKELGLM